MITSNPPSLNWISHKSFQFREGGEKALICLNDNRFAYKNQIEKPKAVDWHGFVEDKVTLENKRVTMKLRRIKQDKSAPYLKLYVR